MKNLLVIIVLFGFNSELFAQDSLLAAFRSVHISNGKDVGLSTNIVEIKNISRKIDAENFVLNRDAFNYVDSFGIEVNQKNQIIALTFHYGYDSAYVQESVFFHEQKKYRKMLSANGKEYGFKSDNLSVRVNKWEDKSTIYELIEYISKGQLTVYSRIFDKELYYQKYSKKNNLDCQDNSLELLRVMGFF
jgi:hypothetical protein